MQKNIQIMIGDIWQIIKDILTWLNKNINRGYAYLSEKRTAYKLGVAGKWTNEGDCTSLETIPYIDMEVRSYPKRIDGTMCIRFVDGENFPYLSIHGYMGTLFGYNRGRLSIVNVHKGQLVEYANYKIVLDKCHSNLYLKKINGVDFFPNKVVLFKLDID